MMSLFTRSAGVDFGIVDKSIPAEPLNRKIQKPQVFEIFTVERIFFQFLRFQNQFRILEF